MGCRCSKTTTMNAAAASDARFSTHEPSHLQPFSSRADLLTRAEKHRRQQHVFMDTGSTSVPEDRTNDEKMRHWLEVIIGDDLDSESAPDDHADHHHALSHSDDSSRMHLQDEAAIQRSQAGVKRENDAAEGIHTYLLGFASFLRQQNINSVIPQPFVDQLAKEVKKPSRAAPGMLRQRACQQCGRHFFLDGWQADSGFCRGCAPTQRSTVSDANMPEAFIHRINGRYTSIVSEAIGRENGRV